MAQNRNQQGAEEKQMAVEQDHSSGLVSAELLYTRDDVQLWLEREQPVLCYSLEGKKHAHVLAPGAKTDRSSSDAAERVSRRLTSRSEKGRAVVDADTEPHVVSESDLGLYWRYSEIDKAWQIKHIAPLHSENTVEDAWQEVVIICPDEGRPRVLRGYHPTRPGSFLHRAIALAISLVSIAVLLWVVLYAAALAQPGMYISETTALIWLGVSIVLGIGGVYALWCYYRSPGRGRPGAARWDEPNAG